MDNNNLNIRLPICLAPDIITDCWNFYRMAIVNAYPNYDKYLLNQFNHIYMDRHRQIHYGFSMYKTDVFKSYSSVLDTTYKSLSELIDDRDFHTFTYECLKHGNYPLIECNYNLLLNYTHHKEYIHEILIYGIDGNDYLIPILVSNRWEERRFPKQLVSRAFFAEKTHQRK